MLKNEYLYNILLVALKEFHIMGQDTTALYSAQVFILLQIGHKSWLFR